jgi:UDP-N-acetylmuramoyl-L-alanyl-D-glutamate--2,6-diaminopimelate ligase
MATTQDMTFRTLGDLLPPAALPVAVAAVPVTRLVLDSRQLRAGDTFLAVPGATRDGRDYIDQAIAAGAALVLAQAATDAITLRVSAGVPVLSWPALDREISALAARFYGSPAAALHMVGVTGTNGKTSFSFWLAHVFEGLGLPAAMIGTLGCGMIRDPLTETGMTTPDAVTVQAILADCRRAGARAAVMEVSSHSLDQHRVAAAEFAVAVFTNLTRDHLDYHGTEAAYRQAKLALMAMASVKTAVINRDDAQADAFIAAASGARVCTYSVKNPAADYVARHIVYGLNGVSFELCCGAAVLPVQAPVMGEFNVSNLLAVIAAAHASGFALKEIVARLHCLPAVPGRMQPVSAGDAAADISVLVDYAHTPDALASVLAAARRHGSGQLWCVFGCGGDRDSGKRPQMGAIAAAQADRIVVTSDNPRSEDPAAIIAQIVAGIPAGIAVEIIEDRAQAIQFAISNAVAGDCVVLAGKGHETYQQIGTEKLPFDDGVQARLALQQRRAGGVPC